MSQKDMVSLNYRVNAEDFAKAGDASSNTKKVLKKLGYLGYNKACSGLPTRRK